MTKTKQIKDLNLELSVIKEQMKNQKDKSVKEISGYIRNIDKMIDEHKIKEEYIVKTQSILRDRFNAIIQDAYPNKSEELYILGFTWGMVLNLHGIIINNYGEKK